MTSNLKLKHFIYPFISSLFIIGVIGIGIYVNNNQKSLEEKVTTVSVLSQLRNQLTSYQTDPKAIDLINTNTYAELLEDPNLRNSLTVEELQNYTAFISEFDYNYSKREVNNRIQELNSSIQRIRVQTGEISVRLKQSWVMILVLGILACFFALSGSVLTILSRIQSQRIQAKNRELEKAKTEAEEATVAKSEFLNVMSHEIRTPLNAVIGLSHILSQSNPTASQKKHIELLQFSSENLLSLVNDILDFGKIEAGKVELEERPFDLVAHIRKIISTLEPYARSKNLELLLEIHDEIKHKVMGDPTRLGQIVFNLINNAIKFTPTGKVKLMIDNLGEGDGEINLKLTVVDTGIGIEPEVQKMIFEGFSQANSQTNRKYGGSGLGLTISSRLLHLMGSELILESEIGKGSRFWFTLNFNYVPGEEHLVETAMGDHEIDSDCKVLVVEDNRINLLILEKLLLDLGIKCDTAMNGKEAVDKALISNYDLVLMDLQMPIMDGYSASKEIGDHFKENAPTIIAISAANEGSFNEELAKHGMVDFIQKPIDIDQFTKKIRKFLNRTPA